LGGRLFDHGGEKLTIDEIIKFIESVGTEGGPDFGPSGLKGGIRTQQVPDEIAPCLHYLMNNGGVRSYCEVGSAAGGTTWLFHHFLHPEKIVIVDDNKHPSSRWRSEILKDVSRYEIIGQSANIDVTRAVEYLMKDGGFDLVFIDADHTYSGCKRDAILYKQYVKLGGYLLFHDTMHASMNHGVKRVAWELKQDDRFELIGEYASRTAPPLGLSLFRRKSL
jgi:predicted O-methyltransferase YrrM